MIIFSDNSERDYYCLKCIILGGSVSHVKELVKRFSPPVGGRVYMLYGRQWLGETACTGVAEPTELIYNRKD
jgi:hypothetical protein